MLYIVASYHCMQFQGKLINQTWENYKKPSFRSNFGPNLSPPIFFPWILPLLDVWHSCKLSLHAISTKTNKLEKITENLVSGPILVHLGRQLLLKRSGFVSCKISWSAIIMCNTRKILRKLSDGRKDGQTDRRTSDFIGSCPTNVERSKSEILEENCVRLFYYFNFEWN